MILQELISLKKLGAYRLSSSSNGLLLDSSSLRTRATLGERSFRVATLKLWNTLPHKIRSTFEINTKRHLSFVAMHFIKSYFLSLFCVMHVILHCILLLFLIFQYNYSFELGCNIKCLNVGRLCGVFYFLLDLSCAFDHTMENAQYKKLIIMIIIVNVLN